MRTSEAIIGARVKALIPFVDVPVGTEGVIDEDYGTGVMVAWDLPGRPLPSGYRAHDGRSAVASRLLRDGFDKESELDYLRLVSAP